MNNWVVPNNYQPPLIKNSQVLISIHSSASGKCFVINSNSLINHLLHLLHCEYMNIQWNILRPDKMTNKTHKLWSNADSGDELQELDLVVNTFSKALNCQHCKVYWLNLFHKWYTNANFLYYASIRPDKNRPVKVDYMKMVRKKINVMSKRVPRLQY